MRLTVQDAGVGFYLSRCGADSSRHSTLPRITGWDSVYPSAAPLSRVIMAVYGRRRMMVREPRFHFLSLDDPRVRLVKPFGRLERQLASSHEESVMVKRSLVPVVDDDESVRESLFRLAKGSSASLSRRSRRRKSVLHPITWTRSPIGIETSRATDSGRIDYAHGDETVRPRSLEQGVWSAYSSCSAILLHVRRSTAHFEGTERWATILHPGGLSST